MKPLNHAFHLTPAQRWQNLWYGLAVVLALFVFAMIVGNTETSEDTVGTITLIALGLLTGITMRLGTKRGWSYYAQQYLPDSVFIFTRARKIGVLWRVLVIWFAGRFATSLLLDQAGSDIGLALLFLLSVALVTATALIVGLRFGLASADASLVQHPAPHQQAQ